MNKVAKFLLRVSDKYPKTKLILYHLNVSYQRSSIWSDETWSSPEETAAQIYTSAKEHTEALGGGVQRFSLSAYDISEGDEDSKNVPIDSTAFKVEPPLATNEESIGSEPANGQGLLAQLMRHNQEMHRQSNHAMGTLTYHLARTVEKQAEQIDRLMADRINSIDMTEELLSKKHERDLETKQAEAKVGRDKEMFEKVMQLLPVFINKVTGKELVRQKETLLESVTLEFMQTIKPDMLDRLVDAGILSPQQLILFSTIMEQAMKRMIPIEQKVEQTNAARAASLNTDSDGGGDGGGAGGGEKAA